LALMDHCIFLMMLKEQFGKLHTRGSEGVERI